MTFERTISKDIFKPIGVWAIARLGDIFEIRLGFDAFVLVTDKLGPSQITILNSFIDGFEAGTINSISQ